MESDCQSWADVVGKQPYNSRVITFDTIKLLDRWMYWRIVLYFTLNKYSSLKMLFLTLLLVWSVFLILRITIWSMNSRGCQNWYTFFGGGSGVRMFKHKLTIFCNNTSKLGNMQYMQLNNKTNFNSLPFKILHVFALHFE